MGFLDAIVDTVFAEFSDKLLVAPCPGSKRLASKRAATVSDFLYIYRLSISLFSITITQQLFRTIDTS